MRLMIHGCIQMQKVALTSLAHAADSSETARGDQGQQHRALVELYGDEAADHVTCSLCDYGLRGRLQELHQKLAGGRAITKLVLVEW